MPLKIKIVIITAVLLYGTMVLFTELEGTLLSGFILVMMIIYLAALVGAEKKKGEIKTEELNKLKIAYDELDGQAKTIIRTDLELTKTKEELDKKIEGLYTLYQLGTSISATFNIDELFTAIDEPLIAELGFEKSLIFLIEERLFQLDCKAAIGYSKKEIEEIKSLIDKNIISRIVSQEEQKPKLVGSLKEASQEQRELAELFKVSSFIIAPLVIEKKIAGFIFIGNSLSYTKTTEGDLEMISILANQLATAIEKIIDLDANPLTRLPGNISIQRELQKRITSKKLFAVCYFDLDKFKAYNDKHGFDHGDRIIKETGRIILDSVKKLGNPHDFVGHVGGDDFIVVTTPDVADNICKEVIKKFDAASPAFYSKQEREQGYMIAKDRTGNITKVPLVSISIGVISNKKRQLKHLAQISEIGAEVKDHAKSLKGSTYVTDERKTQDSP